MSNLPKAIVGDCICWPFGAKSSDARPPRISIHHFACRHRFAARCDVRRNGATDLVAAACPPDATTDSGAGRLRPGECRTPHPTSPPRAGSRRAGRPRSAGRDTAARPRARQPHRADATPRAIAERSCAIAQRANRDFASAFGAVLGADGFARQPGCRRSPPDRGSKRRCACERSGAEPEFGKLTAGRRRAADRGAHVRCCLGARSGADAGHQWRVPRNDLVGVACCRAAARGRSRHFLLSSRAALAARGRCAVPGGAADTPETSQ